MLIISSLPPARSIFKKSSYHTNKSKSVTGRAAMIVSALKMHVEYWVQYPMCLSTSTYYPSPGTDLLSDFQENKDIDH